ncbi:MAG: prolyl oligopeptidase family serine peptidase [Spirochaetaceae bacterium]|nr:prolyl oligopeptidase family serine peptidase [Spirochaetaceae bacterium]
MKKPDPSGEKTGLDAIHFRYLGTPDFRDGTAFIWPEHITAIGEVLEDGLVCSALRVGYSAGIEGGLFKPADFQVPGRRVIRTYVNDTGKRRETARKGHYLFLELLVNTGPDANEHRELFGNYKYSPSGGPWSMELPLVVPLRQINTVFRADGRKIAPFNRVNDDQYIEIVDDMIRSVYKDPQTGVTIAYNLFVPPGYETGTPEQDPLPLVFFLHGAGESGYDNRSPVSAYRQALEYLRPEVRTEDPCFLMIPQCPVTLERDRGLFEEYGWYTYIKDPEGDSPVTWPSKSLRAAINALVDAVVPAYRIDRRRIYAAGHSMGGGGVLAALVERPEVFAAAVSFSSAAVFSDSMLEKIKNKPLFFTLAEGDEWDIIRNNMPRMMEQLERLGVRLCRAAGDKAWDGALRGEAAKKQAEEVIARAEAMGASIIYAEFIRDSIVPAAHLSHRASFENPGIRRWLFEKHLDPTSGF